MVPLIQFGILFHSQDSSTATLRMVAKAIETYWQLIMCDKAYCIHVRLLVLLHKSKHDSLFTARTSAKMATGHSKIRSRSKLLENTREHGLEGLGNHF